MALICPGMDPGYNPTDMSRSKKSNPKNINPPPPVNQADPARVGAAAAEDAATTLIGLR